MWWIIAWLACGILTYGYTFAWFRSFFHTNGKEGYGSDLIQCLSLSLIAWPMALATTFYAKHENRKAGAKLWYGWRLW